MADYYAPPSAQAPGRRRAGAARPVDKEHTGTGSISFERNLRRPFNEGLNIQPEPDPGPRVDLGPGYKGQEDRLAGMQAETISQDAMDLARRGAHGEAPSRAEMLMRGGFGRGISAARAQAATGRGNAYLAQRGAQTAIGDITGRMTSELGAMRADEMSKYTDMYLKYSGMDATQINNVNMHVTSELNKLLQAGWTYADAKARTDNMRLSIIADLRAKQWADETARLEASLPPQGDYSVTGVQASPTPESTPPSPGGYWLTDKESGTPGLGGEYPGFPRPAGMSDRDYYILVYGDGGGEGEPINEFHRSPGMEELTVYGKRPYNPYLAQSPYSTEDTTAEQERKKEEERMRDAMSNIPSVTVGPDKEVWRREDDIRKEMESELEGAEKKRDEADKVVDEAMSEIEKGAEVLKWINKAEQYGRTGMDLVSGTSRERAGARLDAASLLAKDAATEAAKWAVAEGMPRVAADVGLPAVSMGVDAARIMNSRMSPRERQEAIGRSAVGTTAGAAGTALAFPTGPVFAPMIGAASAEAAKSIYDYILS